MSVNLAIDLGTSNTRICIPEKKIIVDEPSVVTIDLLEEKLIAVGKDAYEMLGKTSERFKVFYPLEGGVVCDFNAVHDMIKQLLVKVGQDKLTMPKVVACIPTEITEVEKRAVVNAISTTGVRKIYLMEEIVAAAVGTGLDIEKSEGFMAVNIGGGTSEIAVLSLGGIASYKSTKIAGNSFDDEIIKYIKSEYNLLIGKRTAESVKKEIGCLIPLAEEKEMLVKGRDMISGLPRGVKVRSNELIDVLMVPTKKIITVIKEVLENTSPELLGDVLTQGIHFSGGIAYIEGFGQILTEATGLQVNIKEAPEHAAIIGSSLCLKYVNKKNVALSPLIEEF